MRRGEAICVRTGSSVSKISVVYIIQHLADAIVDVRSNQLPCMHGHIYNSQRSLYGIVDESSLSVLFLFPCHLNMCSVRGYSARTTRKTSKLPNKGFPLPLLFLPVLPLGRYQTLVGSTSRPQAYTANCPCLLADGAGRSRMA